MPSACSKGGNSTQPSEALIVLSGTVLDGPIVNANINVVDAHGATIATGLSDATARYSIEIPGGSVYPITLRATSGTDLVTQRESEFQMLTILTNPQQRIANLSILGTLIGKTAACGTSSAVTYAMLETATRTLFDQLAMGLDVSRITDPVSVAVNNGNVADMVLANEVFGEVLRRAGSVLGIQDYTQILDQLACDLSDGRLDGSGPDVDIRTVATFSAASVGVFDRIDRRVSVGGWGGR